MTDRVRLCLTGRMTERLIERARAQGAAFERIERQDARSLRVVTSTSGARLVCALAEEYVTIAELREQARFFRARAGARRWRKSARAGRWPCRRFWPPRACIFSRRGCG